MTPPPDQMMGDPPPIAPRTEDKPAVLMDLRPCYEGFAGIPQEIRTLFAMFARFPLRRFGGFASGIHYSSRHIAAATPFDRIVAQNRAVISQDSQRHHINPAFRALPPALRRRLFRHYLALTEGGRTDRLDLALDSTVFDDYLWMKLFDRTLDPAERDVLRHAEFVMAELGHEYARSLSMLPRPFQRRVRTTGWDVFFAASVSPYRLSPGTAMMIRYYDALPLLSPHTIGEPWPHARSHGRMLKRNMDAGAHFFCDSEPVRADLLGMFPHAERRVHTIPAVVAAGYFPETCSREQLGSIFRRRAFSEKGKLAPAPRSPVTDPPPDLPPPGVAGGIEPPESGSGSRVRPLPPPKRAPRYFLAVSTLEPRKNYLKLFHAWEIARRITDQPMQLVVVANAGWRADAELDELRSLVREGAALHLARVPMVEMRLLYSMAHCVVAPSRAEGFDYSGAEAMACGAPVLASDITVHRWVYGEAARYFDAYDEVALGRAIATIAALPREEGELAAMSDLGRRLVRAYQVPALAPRWEAAVDAVAAGASATTP